MNKAGKRIFQVTGSMILDPPNFSSIFSNWPSFSWIRTIVISSTEYALTYVSAIYKLISQPEERKTQVLTIMAKTQARYDIA
ncbi:unnamed protein product [Hymenolepis diminuta]|uniref:Uncharacterized protein n=1 Tax=Hymenolepis diminuta TaxID=6216 RepID=A0A564YX12_HYMDI|nr:unnamed protein product [Hymenolepis diminuta]